MCGVMNRLRENHTFDLRSDFKYDTEANSDVEDIRCITKRNFSFCSAYYHHGCSFPECSFRLFYMLTSHLAASVFADAPVSSGSQWRQWYAAFSYKTFSFYFLIIITDLQENKTFCFWTSVRMRVKFIFIQYIQTLFKSRWTTAVTAAVLS